MLNGFDTCSEKIVIVLINYTTMTSKAKKLVEECANDKIKTLDLVDRGISSIIDIPGLCK